jgi:hypothetical protein
MNINPGVEMEIMDCKAAEIHRLKRAKPRISLFWKRF